MKKLGHAVFLIFTLLYAVVSFSLPNLPNPASVNCIKQGNQLVLIKNTGICIFSDSTYCEEWALMRGQCKQGQNNFPGGAYDKTKGDQYCIKKVNKISTVTICDTTSEK